MSSPVQKRSLTIAGHRTSISLENEFWEALKEIATTRGKSVPSLIAELDEGRESSNLSSSIRVYVLTQFRSAPLTAIAA